MKLQEYLPAAKWLSEQEMMIQPMIRLDQVPDLAFLSVLKETQSGICTESVSVVKACSGFDPRSVFLSAKTGDGISDVHGKCRYYAEDKKEVAQLDQLVMPLLNEGYLEDIALSISHYAKPDHFSAENIPEFARLIRRSKNLAVRGLFLSFNMEEDLCRQAKDAFSLVKKIRSDMPCMLHAFCFEGLLMPLYQDQDGELRKTLQMLASLNDTSLYAAFYLI